MTTTTGTSITSTEPPFPLTTTFTPPPGCSSLYLAADCAVATSCFAQAFPDNLCARDDAHVSTGILGCYPATATATLGDSWITTPQRTYSPGYVCPVGMTTAASVMSPAGWWCCPSGLTWAANPPWCSTVLTGGTFISTGYSCNTTDSTFAFGSGSVSDKEVDNVTGVLLATTEIVISVWSNLALVTRSIPARDIVLTARAEGIFLMGGSGGSSDSSDGGSSSMSTSTSTSTSTETGGGGGSGGGDGAENEVVVVGASLGAVLGAVHIAGLCAFWFWFRKKRDLKKQQQQQQQKGVLTAVRGGRGNERYEKTELDTSLQAVRSELEGTLGESEGAGIYVEKAELKGTDEDSGKGKGKGKRVLVKRKAELEGE